MYALLINLTAIDQVRVATPDEIGRVIHANVAEPGFPAGFTPLRQGHTRRADES
ncbi:MULTISPECIES: hypothetical protein [unclassified Mycobacterium]|uniref:hypothetical protein n=1 Tax=unclassified Mycobacterium TaxID=2642494 RepID=UPI000A75AE52|nr:MULTISPECIES: hypothetical protein [unclassified Mycobacterium]